MRDTFAERAEIRRVAAIAREMGMTLSIVSRMLVLRGEGAMVIAPLPLGYVDWDAFDDEQLYELLYSRSYRRSSNDYGEEKEIAAKSSTRKEIYANWDRSRR